MNEVKSQYVQLVVGVSVSRLKKKNIHLVCMFWWAECSHII